METRKKLVKVVEEFEGRDICIERVWFLEILVPFLVDDFHDEVFHSVLAVSYIAQSFHLDLCFPSA